MTTFKLPTQILRGSLRSTPGPSGLAGFTLPCRKVVLEYNDQWPSSKGAMDFARTGKLTKIAQQWPNVEIVLQEKPNKHPMLKAFYVNGKEKGISLRGMEMREISEKFSLLLDQSGKKLAHLKNRPVVAGSEESARGIWSALHVQRRNSS